MPFLNTPFHLLFIGNTMTMRLIRAGFFWSGGLPHKR